MILGTPYVRGNNEEIIVAPTSVAIPEGVVVCFSQNTADDNTIKQVSDTTKIPYGISGVFRNGYQTVVRRGYSTLVQIKPGDTPNVGDSAYVDATGVITTDSNNGIVIGIFQSVQISGKDSLGNSFTRCALVDIDIVNSVKSASSSESSTLSSTQQVNNSKTTINNKSQGDK